VVLDSVYLQVLICAHVEKRTGCQTKRFTCVRLLVAIVSETIVLASRNSVAVYITRVNNFVDCGFVAPYYKILTLTHIHIIPAAVLGCFASPPKLV
jgi:hypothetical protein